MSELKDIVAQYILDLPPYPKGKEWRGEDELVRLSANENPAGPSSKAFEAIAGALRDLHRYPDGTGRNLKARLAEKLGLAPDEIILGNGSDEIFELVVKTFLIAGDEVLLPEPTFAYYRLAAQSHGGQCIFVPLRDFKVDLMGIVKQVSSQTKLIFLCNPNNPTGTFFTRQEFEDFVTHLPSHVVVVVDEAYGEYVVDRNFPLYRDYLKWDKWIVTAKTFSKFYGLAGLRVGFGMGRSDVIEQLEKVRQPFNVSLPALAGAEAALGDVEHAEKTTRINRDGKRYLYRELQRLGIPFIPSEANFILIELGERASDARKWLLRRGIVVRGMDGYGLAGHLRITIGLPDENRKMVEALEECQNAS